MAHMGELDFTFVLWLILDMSTAELDSVDAGFM